MIDHEWLDGLKVGDEVAVAREGVKISYRLARAGRVTPTQIIVGTDRYRRKDGARVSEAGNVWFRTFLCRPIGKIRELVTRARVVDSLSVLVWEGFDTATLLKVEAIVREAQSKKAEVTA